MNVLLQIGKSLINLCQVFGNSPSFNVPKILLNSDRLNLNGPFSEDIIQCLEFTMEFQSNKLIYQKEYTKRQQIIYPLIRHFHDREGWSYRKISKWLNQSGIKTHRGKKWFS